VDRRQRWEARRWLDDRLAIPGTVHAKSATLPPNHRPRSRILPGKSWISFDGARPPRLATPLLFGWSRRTQGAQSHRRDEMKKLIAHLMWDDQGQALIEYVLIGS